MIYPVMFLLGGIFGWVRAAKRGGQTADKLQYGFIFGIIFSIAALFIAILASKLGLV